MTAWQHRQCCEWLIPLNSSSLPITTIRRKKISVCNPLWSTSWRNSPTWARARRKWTRHFLFSKSLDTTITSLATPASCLITSECVSVQWRLHGSFLLLSFSSRGLTSLFEIRHVRLCIRNKILVDLSMVLLRFKLVLSMRVVCSLTSFGSKSVSAVPLRITSLGLDRQDQRDEIADALQVCQTEEEFTSKSFLRHSANSFDCYIRCANSFSVVVTMAIFCTATPTLACVCYIRCLLHIYIRCGQVASYHANSSVPIYLIVCYIYTTGRKKVWRTPKGKCKS